MTSGARGIGADIVRALAAPGAKVGFVAGLQWRVVRRWLEPELQLEPGSSARTQAGRSGG